MSCTRQVTLMTAFGMLGTVVATLLGAAITRVQVEAHIWNLLGGGETQRRKQIERIAALGPRAVPRLIDEARVRLPCMPDDAVRCLERMFGFQLSPADIAHLPHRLSDLRTIDLWEAWFRQNEDVLTRIGAESACFKISFPVYYAAHRERPSPPPEARPGGG